MIDKPLSPSDVSPKCKQCGEPCTKIIGEYIFNTERRVMDTYYCFFCCDSPNSGKGDNYRPHSETSLEKRIDNALHTLNLDRPDIAALKDGEGICRNISNDRWLAALLNDLKEAIRQPSSSEVPTSERGEELQPVERSIEVACDKYEDAYWTAYQKHLPLIPQERTRLSKIDALKAAVEYLSPMTTPERGEDYKMALRLIRQDIIYRAKCDKTNAGDHPYWGIVSGALCSTYKRGEEVGQMLKEAQEKVRPIIERERDAENLQGLGQFHIGGNSPPTSKQGDAPEERTTFNEWFLDYHGYKPALSFDARHRHQWAAWQARAAIASYRAAEPGGGWKGAFDQFVIDELGPDALAGGKVSIYDAAKKAFAAAWKLKPNTQETK